MFISFEGIDGCGKSTQSSLLSDYLEGKGKKTFLTHEPGDGGDIGKQIRNTILLEQMKNTNPLAELFLFCADRVNHVEKVVKPLLSAGNIVISDRFVDSTVVYQSHGRGIDLEFVEFVAHRSTLGLKPEITFLLDAPYEICRQRLKKRETRKNSLNRMDRETEMFYKRLREGFLEEAGKKPGRIKIIDARGSVGDTHGMITSIIDGRLEV